MKNFIAHTEEIRKEMLEAIDYASSLNDLFKQKPQSSEHCSNKTHHMHHNKPVNPLR